MISRTTVEFWQCFREIPRRLKGEGIESYRLWRDNPAHPSLRFKCVNDRHQAYSVRVGRNWRALGYRERGDGKDDVVTWFWIGSHAEYDRLLASL